jgi:crotonobetainyl-CoA:carnitine CoA-transferase CaiB-like acyl-CoA transferase
MRPLDDIRILTVEQFAAGPFGTLHLADLGATVIRIEQPGAARDAAREVPPMSDGSDSVFFQAFNRGKRSIQLDLKNEGGWEAFTQLVAHSDAVFSNLRADVAARLRLGFESLSEYNPRIVCANLSAYGTGSLASAPGYDYILQAEAGWMSITGEPDGPPSKSGLSLVDYSAGLVAALSILAGVHSARRTGQGCNCDLSLYDTAVSMLTYPAAWYLNGGIEPTRTRHSSHPSIVPFGAFATSDGWLTIACGKERFWTRLLTAVGREELGDDPRFANMDARLQNRDELTRVLREHFSQRPTEAWLGLLRTAGVPCGRVRTVAEALDDPFCMERSMLVECDHPRWGSLRLPATSARVGSFRPRADAAPLAGADTRDVLQEILGLSHEQLGLLHERGAFGPSELPASASAP